LRVLDLTDERGALCGRMFAELGADVIKVEPIGGCRTRRIAPFVDGVPGPDRSAYFIAYQAGKRSVTLNLDTADGRLTFADLVRSADFVVESSGERSFRERDIGYDALAEINPRIIYTSITPFGDRGAGAAWEAADITTWAAGGMMFLTGTPGRPPLQISLPQAGLHAGAEAATASLLAHFARVGDGRGQRVVVDTQACVVWTLMTEPAYPILHGDYMRRTGVFAGLGGATRKIVHEVADGHVATILARDSAQCTVDWMAEEGAAPDWLLAVDWAEFTPDRLTEATDDHLHVLMRRSEEAVGEWLRTKTKSELYAGALERRILLAPVSTVKDVLEDEQLAARDYFRTMHHPATDRDVILPGSFVRYSAVPTGTLRPAPRLGEHNVEVFGDLLGYSTEKLQHMYSAEII
jgi:crotonobetainyl-CoA:carnitine CoA-transferase CaiB-like acyl-CoA transferase